MPRQIGRQARTDPTQTLLPLKALETRSVVSRNLSMAPIHETLSAHFPRFQVLYTCCLCVLSTGLTEGQIMLLKHAGSRELPYQSATVRPLTSLRCVVLSCTATRQGVQVPMPGCVVTPGIAHENSCADIVTHQHHEVGIHRSCQLRSHRAGKQECGMLRLTRSTVSSKSRLGCREMSRSHHLHTLLSMCALRFIPKPFKYSGQAGVGFQDLGFRAFRAQGLDGLEASLRQGPHLKSSRCEDSTKLDPDSRDSQKPSPLTILDHTCTCCEQDAWHPVLEAQLGSCKVAWQLSPINTAC